MPDLITHLVATHFISRTPNLFRNKLLDFYNAYRLLIYLGTIFPDLISKPLAFLSWKLYNFSIALHSPFCVLIECFIFSQFIYIKNRKTTFGIMIFFSFFHILVDSLQEGINPGYQILYPFSFNRYGFNWVSSEMYLQALVVFLIIAILIETYLFIKRRKT
jgi:hypothetical protein